MGEWFFIDSLSADCSVVFFPCGLTGDAGLITGVARIPSVSPWEELLPMAAHCCLNVLWTFPVQPASLGLCTGGRTVIVASVSLLTKGPMDALFLLDSLPLLCICFSESDRFC